MTIKRKCLLQRDTNDAVAYIYAVHIVYIIYYNVVFWNQLKANNITDQHLTSYIEKRTVIASINLLLSAIVSKMPQNMSVESQFASNLREILEENPKFKNQKIQAHFTAN